MFKCLCEEDSGSGENLREHNRTNYLNSEEDVIQNMNMAIKPK